MIRMTAGPRECEGVGVEASSLQVQKSNNHEKQWIAKRKQQCLRLRQITDNS